MEGKKGFAWAAAPAAFALFLAAYFAVWTAVPPEAVSRFFDQGGYSPFELATIPFYAALVPLIWWKRPFGGSRLRQNVLCAAVSIVAAMAIVKELDLHNAALHALYPAYVGDDGGLLPGLVRPDGRALTGTPFKMRVLTNPGVPAGMKAAILFYFAAFFGVFGVGFVYLLPSWLRGVFALRPSAWSIGCFGASGVMVQLADRLPAWLKHGAAEALEPLARAFCTVFEEGGELMIAAFAILAIFQGAREKRNAAAAKTGSGAARRVLFWGRFDHGYSRNRVNIALFRKLGWEVDFFDVKVWPRFGDVEAALRGLGEKPRSDLVWVPVCRQRDILAACRWAKRNGGVKVLFDPMISAWDKKVLEQRKWRADSSRAAKLHRREGKMMNAPDFVTWDTSCHVDFCAREFGTPREKMAVLFTGTDETVFKPEGAKREAAPGRFRVLYHGAYIPLHGTQYIIEAARLAKARGLPIEWNFLGWGAYRAETEALAKGLDNVKFLEKVPYEDVPKAIYAADAVFGVFGTTEKASRVIGNKVFEAMACARPVINEYCTGYPPEAKDCKAIKFVPPGDAEAILAAVEEYRADALAGVRHDEEAYAFFREHLSMEVVERQLRGVLERLGF